MMRKKQDGLQKASKERIREASSLKKECAFVRKSLRNYLNGQVFFLRKRRISRHLKSCAVCSSAFEVLKHERETRLILRDVTPPEGLLREVLQSVSGLSRLRRWVYRPLSLLFIAVLVAGAVLVVMKLNRASRQGDVEIEKLEKALPPARVPESPQAPPTIPEPEPEAVVEPLIITVTPENDQDARQRINDVLKGQQEPLRNKQFDDKVKEITGKLTAEDLQSFIDRIKPLGRVRYSWKRFESYPEGQAIPFIMRLKPAPRIVEPPRTPPAPAAQKPVSPPTSAPSTTASTNDRRGNSSLETHDR